MTTDTPAREPLLAHAFDVEYARSHVGPATGRGFIEFLLEKACDEIERAHNEILSLVNGAKSIVAVERERDAALARLALAEQVVEAMREHRKHQHRVWDHSPGCPSCDAFRNYETALAAYDAAKDGTEGAECDTKG